MPYHSSLSGTLAFLTCGHSCVRHTNDGIVGKRVNGQRSQSQHLRGGSQYKVVAIAQNNFQITVCKIPSAGSSHQAWRHSRTDFLTTRLHTQVHHSFGLADHKMGHRHRTVAAHFKLIVAKHSLWVIHIMLHTQHIAVVNDANGVGAFGQLIENMYKLPCCTVSSNIYWLRSTCRTTGQDQVILTTGIRYASSNRRGNLPGRSTP